jgi:hypothetical protein
MTGYEERGGLAVVDRDATLVAHLRGQEAGAAEELVGATGIACTGSRSASPVARGGAARQAGHDQVTGAPGAALPEEAPGGGALARSAGTRHCPAQPADLGYGPGAVLAR